eukprot:542484_1
MSVDIVWWYDAFGCDETDAECYSRWTEIHYTAIIPTTISFCCSSYIIIMSLIYLKQFREITFGATLPMFIAICDAGFHLIHGTDHLYSLNTKHLPPNTSCKMLGSAMIFFMHGQTCWAVAIALFVNYCVRKAQSPHVNYKHFNFILHVLCWGIPTLLLSFGYLFNVYGSEGPWCGIVNIGFNAKQTHLFMIDFWIIIAYGLLIIIYSWTGLIIYKKVKDIEQLRNKPDKIEKTDSNIVMEEKLKKIKRIIRTLPWFPAVYVTQWSTYLLWIFVFDRTWFQTILVVTIANCGGMMNVLVFYPLLMNPVRREQRKEKEKRAIKARTNKNQMIINIETTPKITSN